jgi:HK97 family phage major capsid protein
MSNKFDQFVQRAQFDKKALKDGLRKYAIQTDPNMLAALREIGYDWGAILAGKVKPDSFEAECSREVIRSFGGNYQPSHPLAVPVPWEAFSTRDTTDYLSTVATGGALVETEIQDKSPIDVLRPTSALLSESTVIVSKKNNISIPRISVYPTPIAGSGETVTTLVTQGFTSETVPLVALNYSVSLNISRQILEQAADREIQNYIVKMLRANIGQQIDYLSLYGNGSGCCLGLFNMADNPSNTPIGQYDPGLLAPSWTYTQGTAHASCEQAARYLNNGNYQDDSEARIWLISGATKQNWSQTLLSSNNSFYLFDHQTGRVLNYRAKVTNQLSNNYAVLIDTREPVYLFVGGGAEVTVDPFLYATSYQVRIIVNYFMAFSLFRGGATLSSNATNNNL